MTLKIIRLEDSKYVLQNEKGEKIAEYNQTKMMHPHDWVDDARDAGYDVNGPFGWEFIDERDDE